MDQPILYRDWGRRARGLVGVDYRWRLQSRSETITGPEMDVHKMNKASPQRLPYPRLHVAIAISLVVAFFDAASVRNSCMQALILDQVPHLIVSHRNQVVWRIPEELMKRVS